MILWTGDTYGWYPLQLHQRKPCRISFRTCAALNPWFWNTVLDQPEKRSLWSHSASRSRKDSPVLCISPIPTGCDTWTSPPEHSLQTPCWQLKMMAWMKRQEYTRLLIAKHFKPYLHQKMVLFYFWILNFEYYDPTNGEDFEFKILYMYPN